MGENRASQMGKEISDHHRLRGSWGPGPRSQISADLQSGGHFTEAFVNKNGNAQIVNDSPKKSCLTHNKTRRPKLKFKETVTCTPRTAPRDRTRIGMRENRVSQMGEESVITIACAVRGGQDPGSQLQPNCSLAVISEKVLWRKMMQSGWHFKEGFVEKNDYQYFTQKILCDFKQNTSPKIQKKPMITIA
jgi:hypothetical protein